MLIPTANRKAIYNYLYQEGVLVAKKDFNAPKHFELEVPNLQVIKACTSLKSKGLVTEQFSWQYHYFFLTDKGVEYLREYLHLPAEIVPKSHMKSTSAKPSRLNQTDAGADASAQPQQDEYRRRGPSDEKKVGASGDFKPEFRGGFGRGAPRKE